MTVEPTPAGPAPAASAPVSTPAPAPAANEQTPAPSAAAPAEQAKTEPGTPAADPTAGQGEKDEQKPKSRFQERIDQLTAQKRDAEARAAAAEARLRRLETPPEAPNRELSFEEQEALRLRQVVRQERADDVAQEREESTRQIAVARAQMFQAKVEAVADRMPDLMERFSAVPVSDFAADFIAESEKAPEIAYYLGSNPHEANRLARLPVTRQAIELARLESKLQAAPQVRRTSAAPNPPPMVGGGTAVGPKPLSEMSMSEYRQYREAQDKARGR